MFLSFKEFIKSDSGICLLLAIGCVICAFLLVLLIIKDKKKNASYTKLNLEQEIEKSNKKEKKEIGSLETKEELKKETTEEKEETIKPERVTNYHVSKHPDGGWQVKREGASKALKKFTTQAEAIAFAKEKSSNQENKVVIHKKSGQIRKQDYSKK